MMGGVVGIIVLLIMAYVSLSFIREGHNIVSLPLLVDKRGSIGRNNSTQLTPSLIVGILEGKGMNPSRSGKWIVFMHQGDEYAMSISGYPVMSLLKQSSLEDNLDDANHQKEIADKLTREIMMTKISITDEPSRRVIFHLDAIENNASDFASRLEIYLAIIGEAEERFFQETAREKR